MMVSFTANFAGAVWQPYTSRVQVNLPSTGNVIDIWVKVRDGAGNESNSEHLTLQFSPTTSSGFLLYGTTSVRLEDGVTLVGATGGSGALASEGTTTTEIGSKGATGDVVSKGPVLLRAEGTVYGYVETAQTLTQQGGATVQGAISEHATVTLPGLPAFTISPGTGAAVSLEPNQTRTLTPGNYGDLALKRGSKLTIQSGTYRFKAVQIETDAQLILNKTAGALRIHMASFVHRGKVVEKAGSYGQTLFAVAGTNDIFIEGPFIGTLRAPNAQATIGTSVAQVHYGTFQAKSLLVRSKSTLYHLPWTY